MMRIFFLAYFFKMAAVLSQTTLSIIPQYVIEEVDCQYFATDPLRNVYVVTSNYELIRYDSIGRITARFSDKKAGRLHSIDAHNPFQVVLYYADYQQLTILDRQFTVHSKLALNDMGVQQISTFAISDRNELWLYDLADRQLKKWLIGSSNSISLSLPLSVVPTSMKVYKNRIYLNINSKSFEIYDIFGQFLTQISENCDNFYIFDNTIYCLKKDLMLKITTAETPHPIITSFTLPELIRDCQQFRLENNYLYVLKNNNIFIYPF